MISLENRGNERKRMKLKISEMAISLRMKENKKGKLQAASREGITNDENRGRWRTE